MTRTELGAALTQAHKAAQDQILADVVRRLVPFWAGVDPNDLRGTLGPWIVGAGYHTRVGWQTSATVARAYYVALRRVENATGAFVAPWPDELRPEVVRGATVAPAIRGVWDAERRGATPAEAKAKGLARATGSIIKVVADGGRETILGLVAGDAQAVGYQRVTDSDPCAFCRMLAGRGIVKYTRDSAAFQAHAHCGCAAEPAFEGSVISPQNAVYRDQWKAATRGRSDALNAFRRHIDASAMGVSD